MRIEDLAEVLGDLHGTTQAEMETYLLERVDDSGRQPSEMFRLRDLAEAELTASGERELRQEIAEQFRAGQ